MTGAISPQVADWNGDGLTDLLVGDGMGYINYFQRLPNGKLTEKPDISANGTIIDVGSISAPVVTDWNNDGLLDLAVGVTELGYSGKEVRVYLNSGTADNPVLTDYDILFCGNDTIKLPHPEPEVADLDSDGLNDLLVSGYYSDVSFYKNVGTAQNPAFITEEVLDLTCANPVGPNRNICVCDWDRNGAPDILYGASDGFVYRFMNNTPVTIKEKNPFAEYLIPKSTEVEIFNIQGRLVDFGNQGNIPRDLPNGMYYIKVSTNNGSLLRKMVIIK